MADNNQDSVDVEWFLRVGRGEAGRGEAGGTNLITSLEFMEVCRSCEDY